MTNVLKITIALASLIILAIFAYIFRSAFTGSSEIVWDAKTTVPGTGVTFSYPREGFYGQGVKLINNQWATDLFSFKEVESLYLISLPEGMGSQQTYVRIFELEGNMTLEKVLEKLSADGGTSPQSRYQEINGVRYSLHPSSPSTDISAYNAYAVVNGQLLAVNMQGGFDGSNNAVTPDLVMQFLSGLDFTCASDCSVNSAPVTDAFRGEQ